MALLQDILFRVNIRSVEGATAIEVGDLQIDSRKVSRGSAFIAIKGSSADGHQFIDTAVNNGAGAIICETMPSHNRSSSKRPDRPFTHPLLYRLLWLV